MLTTAPRERTIYSFEATVFTRDQMSRMARCTSMSRKNILTDLIEVVSAYVCATDNRLEAVDRFHELLSYCQERAHYFEN